MIYEQYNRKFLSMQEVGKHCPSFFSICGDKIPPFTKNNSRFCPFPLLYFEKSVIVYNR